MQTALATFQDGRIELAEAVDWPNGTRLAVTPMPELTSRPAGVPTGESYRDFILRLAGSFGDAPFERPEQGAFERREDW